MDGPPGESGLELLKGKSEEIDGRAGRDQKIGLRVRPLGGSGVLTQVLGRLRVMFPVLACKDAIIRIRSKTWIRLAIKCALPSRSEDWSCRVVVPLGD